MKQEELKERIVKGIEEYEGHTPAVIEIYRDPKVHDTYAIRTKYNVTDDVWIHWLLIHFQESWTALDIADNIEECEFETWPPKSGNLKFF